MNEKQNARPWKTWRWTIILALIAIFFTLLTYFVAANFVMVETRLFVFTLNIRLAWALLYASALGFVIGLLVARLRH